MGALGASLGRFFGGAGKKPGKSVGAPKPGAKAHSPAKGPHLRPVSATHAVPVVHKETEVIPDLAALGTVKALLSGAGGPYDVPEHLQRVFAVLELASGIVILVRVGESSNSHVLSIADRIRARSAHPVSIRECAPGALAAAYQIKDEASNTGKFELSPTDVLTAKADFTEMVLQGIKFRATDLHIEARKVGGLIRFRVDGRLQDWEGFPYDTLNAMCGHAFTSLAEEGSRSEGTYNPRFIQSCMIPFEVDGKRFKLRYNSMPMAGGFDVVLRVLNTETAVTKLPSFEDLGYEKSQSDVMELAVRSPRGLIILSGETGSGKSTTLMVMSSKKDPRKKCFSLEDPVEYLAPWMSQVSVQRSANSEDNPFMQYLRGVLRMDPDIVNQGEIRDSQTAEIAAALVQTGHQVMTTLHAGSVMEVVMRLVSKNIGLPRDVVAAREFLSLVIYQVLVPKLCTECAVSAEGIISGQKLLLLQEVFGIRDISRVKAARPGGCEHCTDGEKGLTVVAEMIMPDTEFCRLIWAAQDFEAEKYWRSTRKRGFDHPDMTGKTAFEHGIYKVSQGIIDLRTLESMVAPIERYEPHSGLQENVKA